MAYEIPPSASTSSQLSSNQFASVGQAVPVSNSSAQQREMDKYLNVFKVQPLYNVVPHNASALSESSWPLSADALKPDAATTMSGGVHYEPESRQEETLQHPNALTTLEGPGVQANLHWQQPMQSATAQNMTYPINPTAGFLGNNLSDYQPRNGHVPRDATLSPNVIAMEAQLRRLREENQRMWEIICMLLSRELIQTPASL